MLVIRPVATKDAGAIGSFAQTAHAGLTSLPRTKDKLHAKIDHSQKSFDQEIIRPFDELYFFALEDLEAKTVAGTCAIYSKMGVKEPLYFWRVEEEQKRAPTLNRNWTETTIRPVAYRHGPTEIGTLYLFPDYRKGGWGRLLSLSRFLFMASFPERVERTIIAEMRGYIDTHGESPFWDHIGRQFLDISFVEAMGLLEHRGKGWIPEFLPHHPLYLSTLHPEAKKSVRRPHQNTRPALRMLEKEGFHLTQEIDIFDAGPKLEAHINDIRVIKEHKTVEVGEISDHPIRSERFVASNTSLDFRSCYAHVKPLTSDKVAIERASAEALQVDIGSTIRYVSPIPAGSQKEAEKSQRSAR